MQPGISLPVGGVRDGEAFTLDTSGAVVAYDGRITIWPDLSPFEQGYVEALFVGEGLCGNDGLGDLPREKLAEIGLMGNLGFSDLAAETLAAIRKDCAFLATLYATTPSANEGQLAWDMRQAGKFLQFPKMVEAGVAAPLAVTLGDDGKVRFSPADDATDRRRNPGKP